MSFFVLEVQEIKSLVELRLKTSSLSGRSPQAYFSYHIISEMKMLGSEVDLDEEGYLTGASRIYLHLTTRP